MSNLLKSAISLDPVIVVTKGTDILMLYANKSEATLNGNVIQLDGVVVYN